MGENTSTLDYNFSLYLDFLRLLASFIVFTGHARGFLLPSIDLGPFSWGREAVAVFFVLSGFVISHVVSCKEADWRTYLAARLARIYPVAILAIIVTTLCDGLGKIFQADYYNELPHMFGGFYQPIDFTAFLSYISFTNQLWFHHAVYGTNEPYWSLGFEVQYYIFFLIFSFTKGNYRLINLALWSVVCGPKILMYLPLWLFGVLTYKIVSQNSIKTWKTALITMAFSVVIFAVNKHYISWRVTNMYNTFNLKQELWNIVYFTSIGISIVINLLAFSYILKRLKSIPKFIQKSIKWLAGGSFTLYLVHQPILVLISSFFPPEEANLLQRLATIFSAIILCYLLAECAERKKKWFSTHIFTPIANRI